MNRHRRHCTMGACALPTMSNIVRPVLVCEETWCNQTYTCAQKNKTAEFTVAVLLFIRSFCSSCIEVYLLEFVSLSSDDLARVEDSHRAVSKEYGRHAFRGTPQYVIYPLGYASENLDYTELISYCWTINNSAISWICKGAVLICVTAASLHSFCTHHAHTGATW